MARHTAVDETALTKMEIRKLKALKRSIGDELGEKAFLEWLRKTPERTTGRAFDRTAQAIADAVMGLIESGEISRLSRGGYVVKRGRGRVLVEPAA